MTEDPVRLEVEAERAAAVLQRGQDYYVPLAAAAAIAFHQAQGTAKAIVSGEDYNDDLPSTLRPRASRAPPPDCI